MAGTPIVNAQQRAAQLGQIREEFANNPGILRKMVMGLTEIPHKAWKTGEMPSTPQSMAYSLNALSGGMAGAAARGGSSLGIFGGKMARTANHNMRDMAEAMEKAGSPSDTIWEATGWGRGKDGQWRFEIDDSPARLAQGFGEPGQRFTYVGREFLHPELYENYPQLKGMELQSDAGRHRGVYHESRNGSDPMIGISTDVGISKAEQRSTMLHELQHAVQEIEGFGRGANPRGFTEIVNNAKMGRVDEALDLVSRRADHLFQTGKPEVLDELNKLRAIADKLHQLREQVRKRGISPYEQYRRVSGETEARNVQTREGWDAQKRSDVPPEFSEDVPRSKQTVRFR